MSRAIIVGCGVIQLAPSPAGACRLISSSSDLPSSARAMGLRFTDYVCVLVSIFIGPDDAPDPSSMAVFILQG